MIAGLARAAGAAALALFTALNLTPASAATIAIDVGHFREEPGATSARGRPEFAFNLDLARDIETELRARGYATQLIGADGEMRDLWRRPHAARGADLFISVHHDSTQARYQSTWTYEGSEQRYSDMFAGFSSFVSRENAGWRTGLRCASAIGNALVKAGFAPSLYHAHPVLGENRQFADKTNGVHYFDNLAVLRRADMPALLFEAGVIVNREEELRLRDGMLRKQMATGVADGIEACLKKDEGKINAKNEG